MVLSPRAKTPILGLGFLLLGVSAHSDAQQPGPMPPIEQLYKMPAVYAVPGMDRAAVRTEIVYKSVETKKGKCPLKLDVYVPDDGEPGKLYPAVILISGGGIEGMPYDFRDAAIYVSYGRILAASGFVGISYSKRYARGPVGARQGSEDTRDLVNYIREHAVELRIDKDRLAFWGFSAGGLVLAPVLAESAAYNRAAICFYCVSDVPLDDWLGLPEVSREAAEASRGDFSIAEQLRKGNHAFPPILVGRAGLDSPDLNAGIDKLVAVALNKNLSIEVLSHPNGRHGFDILDADERSREIIRRALGFLQQNLKAARASFTKRDVDIVAPDGVKLRGTYYQGSESGPAILLFHQCSRSREIWAPLATRLAGEGLSVLTLEPRGIGESQGEQWGYDGNLEHALQYWRKNWSTDAETAYQWLVSQPGVDKNNVGLVGGGCGAFLALLTAESHYPRARSIVLLSDFVDDATRTFIKSAPELTILSAVSEQDPMSLAAAKEIHAIAKNPANRLLPFAEQGHGFGLIEKHHELESTIVDWLKVRLAGSH